MKYFTEGVVSTSEMAFDISFVVVLNILFASVILKHTIIRQGLGLCLEVNKIDFFFFTTKAFLWPFFGQLVFASISERVGNYLLD